MTLAFNSFTLMVINIILVLTSFILTVINVAKCLRIFLQSKLPLTLMIGRVFHLMVLIFLFSAYAIIYFTDEEGGPTMWVMLMPIPFFTFIPNALFLGADRHMPARNVHYKSTTAARTIVISSLFLIPLLNYFLCRPSPAQP